jgi:acyl-CoA thioester hydrolase
MNGYPFACPIQVRWRDVDALGHVNNAVIVTYLETARAELWRERFGGGTAIPFMVARVEVDYRRQITLDDRVRVGVRVSGRRGASYCFEYRVEADGELAAEAVTLMAHVRPGERRPSRIPDDLRARLALLEAPSKSPG